MDKKKKVKVVITYQYYRFYFQWFWLGFLQLEKAGEIEFEYKTNWLEKFAFSIDSPQLCRRIARQCEKLKECKQLLEGYIEYPDGRCKTFCIDRVDSPYIYDVDALKKFDCYFKMQCPKDLDAEGFPLSSNITVPWLDYAEDKGNPTFYRKKIDLVEFRKLNHKIKPLVVGLRRLSYGQSYKSLQKAYEEKLANFYAVKKKKLMCYFGYAVGPDIPDNVRRYDLLNEEELNYLHKDEIDHPNNKRGIAAKILNNLGDNYEARVIFQEQADGRLKEHKELIVPLDDFQKYVSGFQYNLNISGFQLSIPNRFMDSFMVGTGIVTDRLSIKWYLPFEEEVVETAAMGYESKESVDWEGFKQDMQELPDADTEKIRQSYLKKWAPDVVAKYIIETVDKS